MPFVQVLCLLALLAYLLLVGLENPGVVRLPLPLGQGEMLLSTGWAVSLFALLGGGCVLLLLLPPVLRTALRQRSERRERHVLERRLTETLGARVALSGPTGPDSAGPQATASQSTGPQPIAPGGEE